VTNYQSIRRLIPEDSNRTKDQLIKSAQRYGHWLCEKHVGYLHKLHGQS